jgi:hypothetical protein
MFPRQLEGDEMRQDRESDNGYGVRRDGEGDQDSEKDSGGSDLLESHD